VAAYSQPIQLSGQPVRLQESAAKSELAEEKQQRVALNSTATAEQLLEQAFEQQWSDSESEGDAEDAATPAPAHAAPFFGALKSSCTVPGCIVTPLPLGRFYHRCAATNALARPFKALPRALAVGSRVASSSPSHPASVASPVSRVSSRGLLLWGLPHSLSVRVNAREFVPSPFRRMGVLQPRDEVEAEQKLRQRWIHQQTQQHTSHSAASSADADMSDA